MTRHTPKRGLVESPVLSDGHAGFGRRHGETHWWKHQQGAPCRPHTIRFAKQTLGATTPKIRTPEQADRWTWLILAALTQLRLARNHVADHRLPWQPPLPADKMTPGRVRAGFAHLLPRINNPANWPKPSRPGPGRPRGRKSTPATRHPAAKKTTAKAHQQAKRR
jgi:hypothetical protein